MDSCMKIKMVSDSPKQFSHPIRAKAGLLVSYELRMMNSEPRCSQADEGCLGWSLCDVRSFGVWSLEFRVWGGVALLLLPQISGNAISSCAGFYSAETAFSGIKIQALYLYWAIPIHHLQEL